MKKSLAIMLALIMVLCMIPTTALAANGTGHQISVKIYKVVLDSSKPLGYQNPELVNTITVICQDATGHSGYNHSVKLKEFYPTNFGLPTTDWTGWQFDSYYTKGKDNNTFYNFTSSRVNATANVTGSEPYSCSKNFYLVYKEAAPQTQDITLTYDANKGTGAPDPETQKVEKGQSATFTVSTQKPTRENYTFKGWSTAKNAAAAEYKGGDSITISQDTTLYAVWEENNPTPPTPPTTDKPEPPKPENTPGIPGLTGEKVVKVMCVTENSSHAEKSYQLIADSYDVGNVEGDATSGYTCTITVDPAKYVTKYNETNGDHTLNPNPQSRSITFEWNNNSWALAAGQNLPITFTVVHNTQEPPTDTPNLPADIIKELVGSGKIQVQCTTANTTHPIESYSLLDESYTTGTVTKDGDAYTCTITVDPAKYVAEYNKTHGSHTLKPNSQSGSITFKWENDEWTLLAGQNLPITFTVVHDTQEPPTPSPSTNPNPTPTPTPGGGNGGGGHWHPTTTPVPVIVIPPKTGDMTIWQSILHFLGIR